MPKYRKYLRMRRMTENICRTDVFSFVLHFSVERILQ